MINESTTPVNERDSARTPDHVFQYCRFAYGPFDVDLAADSQNAKCEKFIDKWNDSLSKDWIVFGERGWCNPPYSNIEPWINKAHIQAGKGFETVMLIPTINGEFWGKLVCDTAYSIEYIFPRISFLRPDGSPMPGNPRGSMVVLFTDRPRISATPLLAYTDMRTWGGPEAA